MTPPGMPLGGMKYKSNDRTNDAIIDILTDNGMTIHQDVDGERTIVSERSGSTFVITGPNSGYIDRPFLTRRGQPIINGPTLVGALFRTYRRFEYRGVRYYDYVPGHSYSPAIYGWAYSPWAIPVSYDWGWGLAPWLSGGYFAPEPYYRSATLWLTDYLIAANLQAAYQAGLKAGQAPADHSEAPPSGGPEAHNPNPSEPDVRHMIATR